MYKYLIYSSVSKKQKKIPALYYGLEEILCFFISV